MDLNENILRLKGLMELDGRKINEQKSNSWTESNNRLERTFKFNDFKQAMEFVNKVSDVAEKQNHHPDIEIKYNKVNLSITDHEEGGVSDKCHKFVKSVDEIKNKSKVNSEELQERCWKGYTQKGMKTMFGKRYPNCVKKNK